MEGFVTSSLYPSRGDKTGINEVAELGYNHQIVCINVLLFGTPIKLETRDATAIDS
jgi:hypothetical protein